MRLVILLLAVAVLGAACGSRDTSTTTAAPVAVTGLVLAGPTCPVVTDPPAPECEDRPVPGAVIRVFDASGSEVARAVADGAGRLTIFLEPGGYRLVPQPVEGLLGTAEPREVVIVQGEALHLELLYDTGIR